MKSSWYTLVLVLFASSAFASTPLPKIEKMASDYFGSILSETYNEGEGYAEVTKSECNIVKTSANGETAFCSVYIDVQPSTESEYKNNAICTSVGFHVALDGNSVENFTGEENCLEYVNGITEF